jgi:hypothetical protein
MKYIEISARDTLYYDKLDLKPLRSVEIVEGQELGKKLGLQFFEVSTVIFKL